MNDPRQFFPELDDRMTYDEREQCIKSALANQRAMIELLTDRLRDMETSAAEAGHLGALTVNQYCRGSLT